jgi:8-oxo-dGTP pyrophosphatase MutT (NUDIX family)
MPIVSYGIIVFKMTDEGIKYLMIQRRHTFGFIDFIRGKYIINNVEQLQLLFNEMSTTEKELIKSNNFDALWNNMWGITPSTSNFKTEESSSQKKFDTLKSGIKLEDDSIITIDSLIENSNTKWSGPEWEFPKGRRNYQEKELICALREFEEETGYSMNSLNVVENVVPYDEMFIGSNHKSYKHKYFLAHMAHDNAMVNKFQETEVSDLKWLTLEECLTIMRPYNIEKKEILNKVSKVLSSYKLL